MRSQPGTVAYVNFFGNTITFLRNIEIHIYLILNQVNETDS